jgi:hypothetical protein
MYKYKFLPMLFCTIIAIAASGLMVTNADAYPRYKNDAEDPGSNCSQCHGDFTDGTSPKGNTFPSDSKHEMHRNGSYMDTECDLCHTQGDSRNPFTGSSNGTSNNTGLGCTGCHEEYGLRAHHFVSGITICAVCHPGDPTPPSENVPPSYYGTVDTLADNPCNDSESANMDENWTVGDLVGLDNDGDGIYDANDSDCGTCGNGVLDTGEDCDPSIPGTECCESDCTYSLAGSDCSDGEYCNGNETCNDTGVCLAGTPVDCSDGIGCTDDSCDEVNDICENTPNDANCSDDGVFCNGSEFCDGALDCSSTGDPCPPQLCDEGLGSCVDCLVDGDCDDGIVCTDDSCVAGTCSYVNNTAPCDDGDICTSVDVCSGGTCAGGSPLDCDAPMTAAILY